MLPAKGGCSSCSALGPAASSELAAAGLQISLECPEFKTSHGNNPNSRCCVSQPCWAQIGGSKGSGFIAQALLWPQPLAEHRVVPA